MTTPITVRGFEQLRAELKELKSVKRPEIVQAIKEAREKGDLSENAEYDAAKELQGIVEARIAELESKLVSFTIINPAEIQAGDKVVFGATVTLEDDDSGDVLTYQVVGDDESDIAQNRVSVSSPIARAMIGRSIGDEVTVHAPSGDKTYWIDSVEYI
ncbi:MAG TPA: transcription elongation factor GreA [Sutterella sp.]|nr:transcription elongation factor GreA [Sutterella sp.]